MSGYMTLPQGKEDLVRAVDEACQAAETERNISYVDWIISHYYLNGVRSFQVWNWLEGDVQVAYEDDQEELRFRYEALLHQYKTELGRYLKIDVTPSAQAEGQGIDSVRKAGISQAILTWMNSGLPTKQTQSRFFQMLLKFGTAGIHHYRTNGKNIRDRTSVEVVPPWELLSVPGEIQTLDDLGGIIRKRSVPLIWLKTHDGLKIPDDKALLRATDMPFGTTPNNYGVLEDSTPGSALSDQFRNQNREWEASQASKSNRKRDPRLETWVELEEVWMYGPRETVTEYVVKVGGAIAKHDQYYKEGEMEVVPAIGIARHTPTGRFYGRSWVGPLLGLNDQIEKMLARQFQIISDMDEYGILVVPTTSGISTHQLEKRERRKVLRGEPDPLNPQYQPYKIEPASSGDFPGKMANLGVQLQDKWSGQGEIYQGGAPGRVESASGLGFLFETGNVSLIPTSNEAADAYQVVFRSQLQAARLEAMQEDIQPFSLPVIDDRMLGVVIGEQGRIQLSDNPIPSPHDVKLDIADRAPVSKQHSREEAVRLLEMGLMDPVQFKILNFRENMGFPIVDRAEWEAWRKAVYQKILLFNDGQTPNPHVAMNIEADVPEISLAVCMQLMASIEFMLSGDAVRAAFEDWKKNLELMLGKYPEQLPPPDALMMMGQQQQPGGAPGAQARPPGGGGALPAPRPGGGNGREAQALRQGASPKPPSL